MSAQVGPFVIDDGTRWGECGDRGQFVFYADHSCPSTIPTQRSKK